MLPLAILFQVQFLTSTLDTAYEKENTLASLSKNGHLHTCTKTHTPFLKKKFNLDLCARKKSILLMTYHLYPAIMLYIYSFSSSYCFTEILAIYVRYYGFSILPRNICAKHWDRIKGPLSTFSKKALSSPSYYALNLANCHTSTVICFFHFHDSQHVPAAMQVFKAKSVTHYIRWSFHWHQCI